MPICIAGMHRSGTSLVARLLNLCGLYLGPEDELLPANLSNQEGYWENIHFVKLNDDILDLLKAGWDVPPSLSEGWELGPTMIPSRAKAAELIQRFSDHEPWGWKDPRNSITLAFWKRLLPDLKVVICLRNPLEVVQSLSKRGSSSATFGLNLWETYNERLLSAVRLEERVITHYDSYFDDPRAELKRVLGQLNLSVSENAIELACSAAKISLRHNHLTTQELLKAKIPSQVIRLYMDMCAEAGPVYQLASRSESVATTEVNLSLDPIQQDYGNALRSLGFDAMTKQIAQREQQVSALKEQLVEKEQAVQVLTAQLVEKEQAALALTAQVAEKEHAVQALTAQVAETKSSKAWKIALLFRRIRVSVIPPNSRRSRVLRRFINVILVPFKKIRRNRKFEEDLALIRSSGLFDEDWYLANNPDVAQAKMDPLLHYLCHGGFEGRDPGPNFCTDCYLDTYEDVKTARINPLVHYLKYGREEERTAQPARTVQVRAVQLSAKERDLAETLQQKDYSRLIHVENPTQNISLSDAQKNVIQEVLPNPSIMRQIPKVSVVIPTKNAGPLFRDTLEKLKAQEYEGNVELVVIDSGSIDDTVAIANEYGATIISIPPDEFDHGLTRNKAIEAASGEIIVLISQDVIPGNQYLIRNFVAAFDDPKVAGACARQVPREDADILTKRNLNIWLTGRKTEEIRWIKDWQIYRGLSPLERYYVCNFDNVCSAIRKSVWLDIPFRANEFGEDIDWAHQVLEAGWKIAYWPNACVIHSHNRFIKYEYDRNFVCHKKLYEQFGIHTVPSWKNVIFSTINSTILDWKYTIRHEKHSGTMLKMLIEIPLLSFAGVYGQYRGAKAGKESKSKARNPSRKMRIVLTVHQFLPDYSAGTEILTYETAKELQKQSHNVSVFTGFPTQVALKDEERFDRYTFDDIHVERFHHNSVPMGDQSNVMELEYNNHLFGEYFRGYLEREIPDVVHFFHLSRLSAIAIDVCDELGIPTVLTPTDFWFICVTSQLRLPNNQPCFGPDRFGVNCLRHVISVNQPPKIQAQFNKLPDWLVAILIICIKMGINFDKRYSPLVRALTNRTEFLRNRINRVDKVVVPTQVMMAMLTRNGLDEQRTTFVPFGLNLAYLQNATRPQSSNILRLGYIGTLHEHKGVHVLVEAVKKLVGKPIELKIYGKPNDYPDYTASLRRIIQDDPRVKFCGTFPNHQIGAIFSDLDALVMPSLWYENSPLVIYSAQAARCPVIASNMAGLSEVIEHGKNGLLFETGNASELAMTIETLLENRELLQKLSDNAKKPLSIQEYATKLSEIYSHLIQEKKAI